MNKEICRQKLMALLAVVDDLSDDADIMTISLSYDDAGEIAFFNGLYETAELNGLFITTNKNHRQSEYGYFWKDAELHGVCLIEEGRMQNGRR